MAVELKVHGADARPGDGPKTFVFESAGELRNFVLQEFVDGLHRVPTELLIGWLPVVHEYAVPGTEHIRTDRVIINGRVP